MKKILCLFLTIILVSCAKQNDLWYLSVINKDALKETTGVGVKCAILDSGFNSSFTKYFCEKTILQEIDLIDDGSSHLNLHGTYVSMLVASKDYGIDPSTSILPIRIIDDAGLTNSELVLKGLQVAKENGCSVVNMSFGSTYYSEDIQNFIVNNPDIIFISSVGDMNQSEFFYPANYDGVYAVSATDKNNELVGYSNVSTKKESIKAPGVDIPLPGRNGEDIGKTGSSYSSAIVSGIICASLSRNSLNIENLTANNLYTNGWLDCEKFLR